MSGSRIQRSRFKLVSTKGRGNCLMHAVALSLPHVMRQMEEGLVGSGLTPDDAYPDFIACIGKALGVDQTWQQVKAEIIRLDAIDPDTMQERLAQPLRDFIIEYARLQTRFKERTQASVIAAFSEYVYQALGAGPVDGVADDMYTSHQAIQLAFNALYAKVIARLQENGRSIDAIRQADGQLLPEVIEELDDLIAVTVLEWWNAPSVDEGFDICGYDQFLDAMQEGGQQAGDFELMALGECLGVNVVVFNGEESRPHYVHTASVACAELAEKDIDIGELVARGVLGQALDNGRELQILPLSDDERAERLDPVPELEKVRSYIYEQTQAGQSLQDIIVPSSPTWSAPCLDQLAKRNVIGAGPEGGHQFLLEREEAMQRIVEVKNEAGALGLMHERETGHQSVIALHYSPEAKHWSCLLPTTAARTDTWAEGVSRGENNWVSQTIWGLRRGDIKPFHTIENEFAEQPIDREDQIAFDRELALRLQQEAYENLAPEDRDHILDGLLARQMQMEGDAALARALQAEEEEAYRAYRAGRLRG